MSIRKVSNMTVVIPLKLFLVSLAIGVALGFVYPFVAWLSLDIGLNLGLGIGRVYALWAGVLLLIVTLVGTIYLLKEGK